MRPLTTREMHRFQAAGQEFVYLVPSAGIFVLDPPARAVIETLGERPMSKQDLMGSLRDRFAPAELRETIGELEQVQAIRLGPAGSGEQVRLRPSGSHLRPAGGGGQAGGQVGGQVGGREGERGARPKVLPLAPMPVSTMVLNVTNQCNLSCTYCYEYGEDKIVDTANGRKPKFMSEEVARQSVELLLRESGRAAHLTFFGGETLLNFPVLKRTIAYGRQRAAEVGKSIDFSLTTNATLLRPDIIEFLAENRVGVTISIDGPREMQDKFRVFHNGTGSYDVVMPKIRDLLQRHRTRPIGARVTLTRETLDVRRIFRHLTEEVGFWEVGFAPVTTASNRAYAIAESGFDAMLGQFRELAFEFLEYSATDRHHGFSNVRDTIEEIHKGVSKAYPCGAGLGLLGVATDGDVALCHRFAGSDAHKFGTVADGLDREAQRAFLDAHHVDDKTDCQRCWARPLCSGGCYHEAHVRYGDTRHANLHYCEWIRGWTHTCLEVYGALSVRNPRFLEQFDDTVERGEVVV